MLSNSAWVLGSVGFGLLALAACNRPGGSGVTTDPLGGDAAEDGGAAGADDGADVGRAGAGGPTSPPTGKATGGSGGESNGRGTAGRPPDDDAGGEDGSGHAGDGTGGSGHAGDGAGGSGDEPSGHEPDGGTSGISGAGGMRHSGGTGAGSAGGTTSDSAGAGGTTSGSAGAGGTTSGSAGGASTGAGGSAGGASTGVGGASDGGAPVGGVGGVGGVDGFAGSDAAGGAPTAGAAGGTACSFDVTASTSGSIATVGVIDWSTSLAGVTSARIVYTLDDAGEGVLNRGGSAPLDAGEASDAAHHTLLLGLKPESHYHFRIQAESAAATCESEPYALSTGTLANVPSITRAASAPDAQLPGFIVTCGGFGSTAPAVIIDADGVVVWSAPAPKSCSRARLDFEGKKLWMLASNASNAGGDLRSVSMDGATTQANLSGLERAHHDFVALEGGRIATLAWSKSGLDPESDLLEYSPDGGVRTIFHVGANLYAPGPSAFGGTQKSYHCNSVTHRPADDSFTIGDRNPNLFVKVSGTGTVEWQFGGSCTDAVAPHCVPGSWQINHGHQLLEDGTFVFFNNTGMGATSPSNFVEFKLDMSGSMSGSPVKQWAGSASEHSDTLGDVQRLPNGNTLVTFSNNGVIYELDPSYGVVQTLKAASFAYSEWRPTLYGPPTR